ncbi:MAG TPA: TetR/AcrR family transcriptional regulator [bacterium]|nr:TetR/AcrR family transcriptional regulator [bacterium]
MAYKKSGETRTRILKAAARIFSERGYYEADIGEIAREAGIGRASFYYYFEDKEKAARAVFDSYVDRILAAADSIVAAHSARDIAGSNQEGSILGIFIEYILLFKYIALNRATHAVYYDLVNFADYDAVNMDRLKRTTFRDTGRLAAMYGRTLSEDEIIAFIVSTNAQAKSIFKAVLNGVLRFDLPKATDYFFRHAILPDIPIPELEYRALLAKAFELCKSVVLD